MFGLLDQSQVDYSAVVRRGGISSQAKNAIVFAQDNKRNRAPPNLQTHVVKPAALTRQHGAGVIHRSNKLQDVIEAVLTAVLQKTKHRLERRRVKMAADGTFLVVCDAVRRLCSAFLGHFFSRKCSERNSLCRRW